LATNKAAEKAQELVEHANAYHDGAVGSFLEIKPALLVSPVKEDYANVGTTDNKPVLVYVAKAEVRQQLLREPSPHLGAGAYRGVCLPWQKLRGHYEVTHTAALRAQVGGKRVFSNAAADLLADASQDPDLFAWEDMAAHAQTKSDKQGRPEDQAVSQTAFLAFVEDKLAKASTACKANTVNLALYWLGFATHALEDLGPHLGRTNPEHAFNAFVEKRNPDEHPSGIALAQDLADKFLTRAVQGRLAPCAQGFRNYSGGPLLLPAKLGLGLTIDGTPAALIRYRQSKDLFAKLPQDDKTIRTRWFPQTAACGTECMALFARLKP